MNILGVFHENDFEPTGYQERPTVKAVVVNENDEVLLFSGGLPGGGVEEGETNEDALRRELLEEVGATIDIVRDLGNVITYRDHIKRKYIFTGYECRLLSLDAPTTTIEHEKDAPFVWKKRVDAILEMSQYIEHIKKQKAEYEGDRYQRHLFNTEAAVIFLKRIEREV